MSIYKYLGRWHWAGYLGRSLSMRLPLVTTEVKSHDVEGK